MWDRTLYREREKYVNDIKSARKGRQCNETKMGTRSIRTPTPENKLFDMVLARARRK